MPVNDINAWCMKDDMKLNQTKWNDMIISFALEYLKLDPIFIDQRSTNSFQYLRPKSLACTFLLISNGTLI